MGSRCENRQFTNRDYAKIELFQGKTGNGVRALEAIEQNRLIIEYVGELIDEDERDRRLKLMKKYRDLNYYFISIEDGLVIDGGAKGNYARFINHSCNPNSESDDYIVDNKLRMGIFASRTIQIGEEITMKYYLSSRYGIECRCGADNCVGRI